MKSSFPFIRYCPEGKQSRLGLNYWLSFSDPGTFLRLILRVPGWKVYFRIRQRKFVKASGMSMFIFYKERNTIQ